MQNIGSPGIYPGDCECAKQKGASTKVAKSENIARTAKQNIANSHEDVPMAE